MRWITAASCVALSSLVVYDATRADPGPNPRPAVQTGHADMIELGRRLFFEPELSLSGAVSCASCHDPNHGFSDPAKTSLDDAGRTRRHSQTIIDCAASTALHWDGEFPDVETLVGLRLGGESPVTFVGHSYGDARFEEPEAEIPAGQPSHRALRHNGIATLLSESRYRRALHAVAPGRTSSASMAETAIRAVALFSRSVRSGTAPVDRFLAGDENALSRSALRGLGLFEGRAGCAQCHPTGGERPRFTDGAFHNTGLEWKPGGPPGGNRRPFAPGSAVRRDMGRAGITFAEHDLRRFKTPTLRDVARHPPYMHDGRFQTLEEVVRYYATGCGEDPHKDPALRPFVASDRDVGHIVAFLESLTSEQRPGRATEAWDLRAKRTRLAFTSAEGKPLAGLRVRLVPAGDRLPVAGGVVKPFERRTDESGALAFEPTAFTHVRIELPSDARPTGGPLVPDTCESARIRLP